MGISAGRKMLPLHYFLESFLFQWQHNRTENLQYIADESDTHSEVNFLWLFLVCLTVPINIYKHVERLLNNILWPHSPIDSSIRPPPPHWPNPHGRKKKKNRGNSFYMHAYMRTNIICIMHTCLTESICIKHTSAVSTCIIEHAAYCSEHVFSSADVCACTLGDLARMMMFWAPVHPDPLFFEVKCVEL